jgi:O-antigen ligase
MEGTAAHPAREAVPASRPGDWPRTGRLAPWLVATLLAMVWLAPFDVITLPVPLPFDAKLDRVLLVGCFLLWALVIASGAAGARRGSYRLGAVEFALGLFLLVCLLSISLNLPMLARLGEAEPAVKQLVLLPCYVAFLIFVATNVRAAEVPAFSALIVVLATVAAVGTLIEYRFNFNPFYNAAGVLRSLGAAVQPDSVNLTPAGRPDVTGPARHGLADCALLAMGLPFALAGLIQAAPARRRLLYGVAAILIVAGALATVRRSGIVLPLAAAGATVAVAGRRGLPILALAGVLVVALPLVAPGAVSSLRQQLTGQSLEARESSGSRTADYPAARPDLAARPVLGRGFGSYDASRYRVLDNQYLKLLIETGLAGVLSFLALLATAGALAVRAARGPAPACAIGLAACGAVAAFGVAALLFDVLAFPHAPYLLLAVLALLAVGRAPRAREGRASGPAVSRRLRGRHD